MSRDILNVDTSFQASFAPESLDVQDLEAVRLILGGGSVIDWNRLAMRDLDTVDRFLRLQLIDPADPADQERLRFVFNQAVNYLEEHFDQRIPPDLRDPADVRELFLVASDFSRRFRRRQAQACMVLKLMHVINHMEAADLKFQTPVSEAELLDRAEKRIIEHADRMRAEGYPLLAFYGSRKTRTSVITKLLAKRDTIAATIFDKLRFRLVVETRREVVPVMAHLTRTLFPFNYIIPGQTQNNLLTFRRLLREEPGYGALVPELQRLPGRPSDWLAERNPFSGTSYRVINFVVDFPIRVDELRRRMGLPCSYMLGHTVFVIVEFQVLDRQTADLNERGENAHSLYKERQRRIVESRLLRGAGAPGRGRER